MDLGVYMSSRIAPASYSGTRSAGICCGRHLLFLVGYLYSKVIESETAQSSTNTL